MSIKLRLALLLGLLLLGFLATTGQPGRPLAKDELAQLIAETPSPRFFAMLGDQVVEICGRRIQGAANQERLFVALPWSEGKLGAIAQLTDARVSLAAADDMR